MFCKQPSKDVVVQSLSERYAHIFLLQVCGGTGNQIMRTCLLLCYFLLLRPSAFTVSLAASHYSCMTVVDKIVDASTLTTGFFLPLHFTVISTDIENNNYRICLTVESLVFFIPFSGGSNLPLGKKNQSISFPPWTHVCLKSVSWEVDLAFIHPLQELQASSNFILTFTQYCNCSFVTQKEGAVFSLGHVEDCKSWWE